MIDQRIIDRLVDWMVDGARPSASALDVIEDVTVGRFAMFIYTLDPNIVARR